MSKVLTKRKMSRAEKREALSFYLYISPWILGFSIFTLFPMALSLGLSFTNANVLTMWGDKTVFIGFKNFINMFTMDLNFLKAISNTFYYAFFRVVLGLTIAFLIALLLNKNLFGKRICRTFIYLPSLIPIVSSSLIWVLLYSEQGILNQAIMSLGLKPFEFLNYKNALNSVLFMAIWNGIGPAMIIFLAALQTVPQDLLEAAKLDGAKSYHVVFKIVIPIIGPTAIFILITNVVGALQAFAEMDMLTGGGPGDASITMTMSVIGNAFQTSTKGLGFACAQSWFIFIIVMSFTALFLYFNKKFVYYGEAE